MEISDDASYKILDLNDLSASQLHELADLHRESLPYSIGSILGSQHLTTLYRILKVDPFTVNRVAICDNQVIGFISTTLRYRTTIKLIKRESSSIITQVIKPRFLFENFMSLIDVFLIKVKLLGIDPNSSYILIFFVSPTIRKKGVGGSLLSEILYIHDKFQNNNIYVDTRKLSRAAIRLYNKNNFFKICSTSKSLILRRLPK